VNYRLSWLAHECGRVNRGGHVHSVANGVDREQRRQREHGGGARWEGERAMAEGSHSMATVGVARVSPATQMASLAAIRLLRVPSARVRPCGAATAAKDVPRAL
jgi:hypothetical protein